MWEEWAGVFVSYLCEVQQHPCGWISDNREAGVKCRRSAVEEWVDTHFSLSHPGEGRRDNRDIDIFLQIHKDPMRQIEKLWFKNNSCNWMEMFTLSAQDWLYFCNLLFDRKTLYVYYIIFSLSQWFDEAAWNYLNKG